MASHKHFTSISLLILRGHSLLQSKAFNFTHTWCVYRFMRIQIFQIKCSEQGGCRQNHENTSDLFPLSCLLGHGTLDANRMQIHLIESGDAEVIVFGEMSKTSSFFSLLLSVGEGFFMKSILNKSYHHSQALGYSFVICGCGCVFNFLSIKSKYAVFFFLPPL